MKNKISVTIITLNEEENIRRCIHSIKEIAEEIIVVDSFSNDKTVDMAQQLGAKVYQRKFKNYSDQKNFAIGKASGEWIYSIDADEVNTKELNKEILSAIRSSEYDGYLVPRRNIIFGKEIKYTRWQPELDRHVWLFRRDRTKWVGNVHEEAAVEGEIGRIENAKVHHSYETVQEFMEMMNRYSDYDADKIILRSGKFSYFRLFFDPIYNFLVRYTYRLGFLDGWRGLVLSYLMAIYHLTVWVKVWERERNC